MKLSNTRSRVENGKYGLVKSGPLWMYYSYDVINLLDLPIISDHIYVRCILLCKCSTWRLLWNHCSQKVLRNVICNNISHSKQGATNEKYTFMELDLKGYIKNRKVCVVIWVLCFSSYYSMLRFSFDRITYI